MSKSYGIWEELKDGNGVEHHVTYRMKVPGGWLVMTKQVVQLKNSEFHSGTATSVSINVGMVQTFVKDPSHDWDYEI